MDSRNALMDRATPLWTPRRRYGVLQRRYGPCDAVMDSATSLWSPATPLWSYGSC